MALSVSRTLPCCLHQADCTPVNVFVGLQLVICPTCPLATHTWLTPSLQQCWQPLTQQQPQRQAGAEAGQQRRQQLAAGAASARQRLLSKQGGRVRRRVMQHRGRSAHVLLLVLLVAVSPGARGVGRARLQLLTVRMMVGNQVGALRRKRRGAGVTGVGCLRALGACRCWGRFRVH